MRGRTATPPALQQAILLCATLVLGAACQDEPDYPEDPGAVADFEIGDEGAYDNVVVGDELGERGSGVLWGWEAAEWETWDNDDDWDLEYDEWNAGLRQLGLYGDWDVDDDVRLTPQEFGSALFAEWDLNDNDILDPAEYRRGTRTWYERPTDFGTYTAWDINRDGWIDRDEWETGYDRVGIFDTWDVNDDGVLDEAEYSRGIFDTWDIDDDGILDVSEARWQY